MAEPSKLEERINNRRRRRWNRRARIIAPFASLPILLATLLLSVDIIEYEPQQPRIDSANKSVSRSMPKIRPSLAARTTTATSAIPVNDLFHGANVLAIEAATADADAEITNSKSADLDSQRATDEPTEGPRGLSD
jgi:hypothetical protein